MQDFKSQGGPVYVQPKAISPSAPAMVERPVYHQPMQQQQQQQQVRLILPP
jgi:hypothetical protein